MLSYVISWTIQISMTSDRLLQRLLNQHEGEGIVLAIASVQQIRDDIW